jgi:HEPN domain-containing protein
VREGPIRVMTPLGYLIGETRRWLKRAREDLHRAEILANDHGEGAAFHCQQAAEASLKAFLAFHQTPSGKNHDLAALGKACLALDPGLPASIPESSSLTEYIWIFRYPGGPRHIEEGEAENALRLAHRLNKDILARLPPESRPEEQ